MNWKTPVTLVVLLFVLLGSAYYGWQAATAPATPEPSSSPNIHHRSPCTKKSHLRKGQRVQAKDVLVNVYNAGGISGLAASTSSNLTAKGFRPGKVTDAPPRIKATNVAILAKQTGAPEVKLVANQFKGPVVFRIDDLGPGVDVVVGDAFQAVDPGAKPFFVVRKTVRSCVNKSAPTP